jgi:rubrerythrin
MTDMTTKPPRGASSWELDLWTHLTSHVEAERGLLEQYSAVAEQSPSKAFSYLVKLLIEDEIRHHRLFTELAASLKTEAELTGEDPIIPYMDFVQADRAAMLDATKQLLANEEQDARELKRLQRELRDLKDTTLWSLLVDLMQRDTQKHVAILRFVRKHARRQSAL